MGHLQMLPGEGLSADTHGLGHPWGNPTVCLAGYGGTRFITDAEETAYFVEAVDQAATPALSPGESIDLIRETAKTWEAHR